MLLAPDFQFSQNNLQDYIDCPRRFQLRHLLKIEWPAVETEPVLEQERQLELGQRFHQMVEQHRTGLPADAIAAQTTDADLSGWWQNYILHAPLVDGQVRVEFLLTAPLAGYRIVAKFDLVAVQPEGGALIIDWKTSRKKPSRTVLQQRVQTRLYQYLVTLAGASLASQNPIEPEAVEMIYWFAEDPLSPEKFKYSSAQYLADRDFLIALIQSILSRGEQDFPLTTDEKRCAFCRYRSLCRRGAAAGDVADLDIESGEPDRMDDLNFEQIAEVQF